MEILIEPEDYYSEVDLYLSLDSNFYIIEEKPSTHIIKNGVGLKFGKGDYQWCTNCYIYLIANIYKEQRYYITSQSR